MGNKPSQSSGTTTLGHSTSGMGEEKAAQTQQRRNRFVNIFSIVAIGKALSVGKKKKNTEAMQMYQPPLEPGGDNRTLTTLETFAPQDFSEIGNTYEVDWTKTGVLGQGHYATVYRGGNVRTNVPVAVKKVSKKLTRIDSLKTEVEALRKVAGHPNIVNLYDVYLDTDYMYLVLELLAGGELFDRIVQSGAYSEHDAAGHMKAIGSALQHMHSRGIVHRDLKPENLVLADNTPESPIKISDFGLSKILKDDEEVMMTICGTKAYSAPEVGFGFRQAGIARNDSGYSAKVDMWSLGVILFVIVAAYHPFDPHGCDNDQVIWSRIVKGQWDFNDKVWDAISEPLKDLLRRLIEPDVDKRLSADEFLKHPWINDAATPIRPLPSLNRVRSSRYWHVHEGMVPVTPKPPAISESAESLDEDDTPGNDSSYSAPVAPGDDDLSPDHKMV